MAARFLDISAHHVQTPHCVAVEFVQTRKSRLRHFVASELKDPICHSNECQIGSFSSEATIYDDHFSVVTVKYIRCRFPSRVLFIKACPPPPLASLKAYIYGDIGWEP